MVNLLNNRNKKDHVILYIDETLNLALIVIVSQNVYVILSLLIPYLRNSFVQVRKDDHLDEEGGDEWGEDEEGMNHARYVFDHLAPLALSLLPSPLITYLLSDVL